MVHGCIPLPNNNTGHENVCPPKLAVTVPATATGKPAMALEAGRSLQGAAEGSEVVYTLQIPKRA